MRCLATISELLKILGFNVTWWLEFVIRRRQKCENTVIWKINSAVFVIKYSSSSLLFLVHVWCVAIQWQFCVKNVYPLQRFLSRVNTPLENQEVWKVSIFWCIDIVDFTVQKLKQQENKNKEMEKKVCSFQWCKTTSKSIVFFSKYPKMLENLPCSRTSKVQ